jgi:uncharacterized protein (TIGR02001 family)
MFKIATVGAAFLAGIAAVPAAAQDAAEETKAITVNGSAAVVSDYRFRGISQTDKNFAVQGSVTATHGSGLYVGVWGSSIDDYVASGGDQEIDLIAGFKKTFGGTTVDVGSTYYYYPGAEQIVPGFDSDFVEFYGSVSQAVGPVTVKVGAMYAPKQSALDFGFGKEDNFYMNASLSGSISGVGLNAGVGHSFSKSYLTGGVKYTDWSLGASYTTGPLTFGLSYVDTDANGINPISGKNIYKGGVVGSLTVAF